MWETPELGQLDPFKHVLSDAHPVENGLFKDIQTKDLLCCVLDNSIILKFFTHKYSRFK